MLINFKSKATHIFRVFLKFNQPFMIRLGTISSYKRSNGKFSDLYILFPGCFHQALFNLFANHMLTKSRDEMLDPACYNQAVRIERNKLNSITQIITPQSSITVDYQCVILI